MKTSEKIASAFKPRLHIFGHQQAQHKVEAVPNLDEGVKKEKPIDLYGQVGKVALVTRFGAEVADEQGLAAAHSLKARLGSVDELVIEALVGGAMRDRVELFLASAHALERGALLAGLARAVHVRIHAHHPYYGVEPHTVAQRMANYGDFSETGYIGVVDKNDIELTLEDGTSVGEGTVLLPATYDYIVWGSRNPRS